MGDLLFTGDFLFAASPEIAGLTGWSQETLIHSLGADRDAYCQRRYTACLLRAWSGDLCCGCPADAVGSQS